MVKLIRTHVALICSLANDAKAEAISFDKNKYYDVAFEFLYDDFSPSTSKHSESKSTSDG